MDLVLGAIGSRNNFGAQRFPAQLGGLAKTGVTGSFPGCPCLARRLLGIEPPRFSALLRRRTRARAVSLRAGPPGTGEAQMSAGLPAKENKRFCILPWIHLTVLP